MLGLRAKTQERTIGAVLKTPFSARDEKKKGLELNKL